MGWPFSRGKSADDVKESPTEQNESSAQELTNYSKGQKFLLEDTKPRFPNESASGAAREKERATLKEASLGQPFHRRL